MIEKLPLLSSDWRLWDWSQSNGNASVEQMQAAYNAIVNQGLCSDFSRLVWNDLVDATADAINAAGLTWDSTYGSVANCKINESLGMLTASAFNAVARNIHNFGFVSWKWARGSSSPGYVGRNEFRGYSTYKEKSDFLYGWHIIELAVKLNRMLQVIKGEAELSEFERIMQATSYQNTRVAAVPTAAFEFANTVDSIVSASVALIRILEQSAYVGGYSYHNGILLTRHPEILKTEMKSVSLTNAETDKIRTQALQYAGQAQSKTNSVLTDLVFVGYLRHVVPSMTRTQASIEISNIGDLNTVQQATSKLFTQIVAWAVWLMETQVHGSSYASPDLKKIESLRVETAVHSSSYSLPMLALLERVPIIGSSVAKSVQSSSLQYLVPRYIKRDIYSLSYPQAKADVAGTVPVMVDLMSNSYEQAKADVCPVTPFVWTKKSDALIDAMIRAVQMKRMETSILSISNTDEPDVNVCEAVRFEAQSKSQSESQGTVETGLPLIVEAAGHAQTTESGRLNVLPEKRLATYEYGQGKSDAAFEIASAGVLNAANRATTHCCCVLELEYNSKDVWKDPVRNGNDLYIRSVYPQWQEENNVHLDSSGIFYDPVQTGSDLYIRSNESMKGVIENG